MKGSTNQLAYVSNPTNESGRQQETPLDKLTSSKILICDDDSFSIMAVKGLLTQFGLENDTASSGEYAISLIKQRLESCLEDGSDGPGMYKLIVMDYSMPGMDGPTTIASIRKMLDAYRQKGKVGEVRICLLTAYASKDFKTQSISNLVDEFLNKPLLKPQLQQQLIKAKLFE